MPEDKTVKNRVHLDVRVAGREVRGEERKRLVSEKVERLVQAGASLAWENADIQGNSVVLRDPEGNEFCANWPRREGCVTWPRREGCANGLRRGDGRSYCGMLLFRNSTRLIPGASSGCLG